MPVNLSDIVNINQDTAVYVAKQTALGTPVASMAAANGILIIGKGNAEQNRAKNRNIERVVSLDARKRLLGAFGAGTLTFPFFLKPNNTATPRGLDALESLFGKKTTGISNVDVALQLMSRGDTRPPCTVWLHEGHTLHICEDVVFNEGEFGISAAGGEEDYARAALTGVFSKRHVLGTQILKTSLVANTAITTFTVDDVATYAVGDDLMLDGELNTNKITITAINTVSKQLTFASWTPAVAHTADEEFVKPWKPDFDDTDQPVGGELGTTQYAGADMRMRAATVRVNNNLAYLTGEKTADLYPTRFRDGTIREVSAELTSYFSADLTKFYRLADTVDTGALMIPAGDTAGAIVSLHLPAFEVDQPTTDDDETPSMTISGFGSPLGSDKPLEMRFR